MIRKLTTILFATAAVIGACRATDSAPIPPLSPFAVMKPKPVDPSWGAPDDPGEAGIVHKPLIRDAGYPHPNGIEYRGGPVMTMGLTVYLIWYGDWREETKAIVADFVNHLGGSPYWGINSGTYYQKDGEHVSGDVSLMGQIADDHSLGKDNVWADSEQAAIAIVSGAVVRGEIPADEHAAIVVLVSGEQRTYDYACRFWCAWHDRFDFGSVDLKIAMVWDPSACPDGCTAYPPNDAGPRLTPNGDLAADGLVSTLAHELEEIATDPDLNAWRGEDFTENADMCSWTYGDVYATDGGAPANMHLGDRDWLIQRNWVNADGGYCATRWP